MCECVGVWVCGCVCVCVCGNPVSKDFESYLLILRTVQCYVEQSKAGGWQPIP